MDNDAKKDILDRVCFWLGLALYASFSFYLLLPFSVKLPGLNTFTLTKALAFIFILAWLLRLLRREKNTLPRELLFICACVLYGVILAFFREPRLQNLKYALNPAVAMLVFCACLSAFQHDSGRETLAKVLLVTGIISTAAAFLELFPGNSADWFFRIFKAGSLVHWNYNGSLRLGGIFCDTNYFSNYMLFFITFITAYFYFRADKSKIIFWLLLLAAAMAALILTFSRSNIIAVFVSLAVMATVKFKPAAGMQRAKAAAPLLLFAVLYIAFMLFVPAMRQRLASSEQDILFSERAKLQAAAMDMLNKSLWTGTGFATYGIKIHNDPQYVFDGINKGMAALIESPHSFYLGIALASGALGLLAALFFFGSSVIFLARRAAGDAFALASLCWLAGWLASGFFGKEFYFIEDSIYFFGLLALGFIRKEIPTTPVEG